jgi:hypothetical protein
MSQIRKWRRGEVMDRSLLTLRIYRKQRLERDEQSYPFRQREEDGSIRDRKSSRVVPTRDGSRITVQSRGAPFIEDGNGPGSFISGGQNGLALPLKRKAGRRGRAFQKAGGKGRVFIGDDGRAYLRVERVRTYRGQRLLEISARQAFGTRQIKRPPLH